MANRAGVYGTFPPHERTGSGEAKIDERRRGRKQLGLCNYSGAAEQRTPYLGFRCRQAFCGDSVMALAAAWCENFVRRWLSAGLRSRSVTLDRAEPAGWSG